MAHLRLPQDTAIFSPSVARAAASTAKDWSYVDRWLRDKYAGRAPPPFERNADTLKMLLALVAANESADEERSRLARLDEAALDEIRNVAAHKGLNRSGARASSNNDGGGNGNDQGDADGTLIVENLLAAIEDGLTKDGRAALDAMASMAVELDIADPTPESLAARFVELQASVVELDCAAARVAILDEHVGRESSRLASLVDRLQGDVYQPSGDVAKQNLELQRRIKSMEASLPELRQQVASLGKLSEMPTLTVDEVKEDEEDYLGLLARKKELDAQVRAFGGLPADVEAARVELEILRAELRNATDKRDNDFERLVERESPIKSRRRP